MTDKSMLQVQSNTATGHYYRGYILDEFIQLEMAISQHIVTYLLLNDSKKTFNRTYVKIHNMTFSNKGKYFGKVLDKLKINTSNPNSSLLKEIELLIKIRNVFAHDYLIAVLPTENKFEVDKVIYLAKFKTGFEVISYSEKDLDELITRINIAEKKVSDFKKKLTISSSRSI
jgi:hypothetical protein